MPDGQHRPAVVVRVWRDHQEQEPGYSNLQVFADCGNDCSEVNKKWFPDADIRGGRLWATSIKHDENCVPGTWHWPEKA
jgi:hypothetical protein